MSYKAEVFNKYADHVAEAHNITKESLCLDCYKQINPPVKEVKAMNIKYCNICGRIHYNNYFYGVDEFHENLPMLMKKRVEVNDGYRLNEIRIVDFEVSGSKIGFDVLVDVDFQE